MKLARRADNCRSVVLLLVVLLLVVLLLVVLVVLVQVVLVLLLLLVVGVGGCGWVGGCCGGDGRLCSLAVVAQDDSRIPR